MELLEREMCLHALDAALRDVRRGAGRIALVSGEAGIGKTVLLDRFTRDCAHPVRVLWGTCDASFTPRPLGPLYDIAAQAQGSFPARLAANADRTAIFAAVLAELQGSPVVAVFEDVHWADEATLDLLRFLGRRIAHTTALLVVTYRDDELGPHHPLRMVLGDLVTSPATRRIPLPPLSTHAVRTLIGGRAIDASALHRQTAGNPFFVTEVLASAGSSIPPSIRDAVLARAARLSPAGLAALQAAAVIGPRIELGVLSHVTGADAHAAEECFSTGMLLAHGPLVTFRHELARQTVLESIAPPHRIVLHRLTLHALKLLPAARDDLACLAHHADGAGDRAAVLDYAPAAASQAGRAGAHRAATALYELALRYADDVPPTTHATLLEAYAQHASRIDRRADAVAALRTAIALRRAAGNSVQEGENHASLVIMLIGMGRNAEAEQASRSAIAVFDAHPSLPQRASGYETQAALRLFDSDYAEAIAWCEKILALPGVADHPRVWRRAKMRLACAHMVLDYERGCAELEHLLDTSRTAGRGDAQQEVEAANLLTNLGWRSTLLYQFHHAERYLADGLAYIAERDLEIFRHIMLAARALATVYVGDWATAGTLADDVLHQPGASTISRITALEARARLRTRRGDSGAATALDEALALATPTGNIQRIGAVRAARAEAAWVAGDRERTLVEACAAYDLAVRKQERWIVGELALWRWRAGDHVSLPDWTAPAFALQIAGDWRAAATAWQELGCFYEQARALTDGDVAAQTMALSIFERLGAHPATDHVRRTMRAGGVRHILRGPRPATRANPFGLTSRQQDILDLLAAGCSNAEIATQLYLSPKTVDHHVSAVLARLNVPSRKAAAALVQQQRHQPT
jgi:DNA-binding CsgD family transcriptional regulator/tetratricopeptide (TPR) repeat protein